MKFSLLMYVSSAVYVIILIMQLVTAQPASSSAAALMVAEERGDNCEDLGALLKMNDGVTTYCEYFTVPDEGGVTTFPCEQPFGSNFCAKTCNKCSDACEDIKRDCEELKDRICTGDFSTWYGAYQAAQCRKTCGLCDYNPLEDN